jgi:hypothetical protein
MTVTDHPLPSDSMRWSPDPQPPQETPPAPLAGEAPLYVSGVVVLEWRLVDLDPSDRAVTADWTWTVNVDTDTDDEQFTRHIPVVAVGDAQTWAEQVVYSSTDLVVLGWHEQTRLAGGGPRFLAGLARRVHHMTVSVDGPGGLAVTFEVTPRRAAKLRRQMRRRGGVLVFDEPLPAASVEALVRRRRFVPAWQAQLVETVEHRPATAQELVAAYSGR